MQSTGMRMNPFPSWPMLRLALITLFSIQRLPAVHSAPMAPKEKPHLYSEGDPVALKVNKLTSTRELYSQEYYRLPFCQPDEGPTADLERLGNFLAQDRIESSPYRIHMKKDMYCEQLCVSNLGRPENITLEQQRTQLPNKVVRAIRGKYHHNWILDGLTAASKIEDQYAITTRYWGGFPVGFLAKDSGKAYIHNHVNIEIMYHQDKAQPDKYQVVRFTVEPFSILHEFYEISDDDKYKIRDKAFIRNPIASCAGKSASQLLHTSYDMITDTGRQSQPASGKALFTYDVIWIESSAISWTDRWSTYMKMDAMPEAVHVVTVMPAYTVMIALAAVLVVLVTLQVQRAHGYQVLLQNEESPFESNIADTLGSKSGVLAILGDLFRPPTTRPRLLAFCCGTGAQLLTTALAVLIYCQITFLSPLHIRAAIDSFTLTAYALMGVVGGYVTAVFTKIFCPREVGNNNGRVTLATALMLPGVGFSHFLIVHCLAWFQPTDVHGGIGNFLFIFFLWFAVSTPLVLLGAYIGFQQSDIPFPIRTRPTPRPIPCQPMCLRLPVAVILNGLFSFCLIFVELNFVLAAVWMEYSYYAFGYLTTVFLMSLIMSTLGTMLLVLLQFRSENHKWWWRSFVIGGGVAVYVFEWSNVFLGFLELQGISWFLYQVYMILCCICLFLMYGFAGLVGSLIFSTYLVHALRPFQNNDEIGHAMMDFPTMTTTTIRPNQ